MRRRRYRVFLIILAILISLIGGWCIYDLSSSNQVVEGTFVYGR